MTASFALQKLNTVVYSVAYIGTKFNNVMHDCMLL